MASPAPEADLASSGTATAQSFPRTREEFDADPRVSWSRLTQKWTLEQDDGSEYEYDEGLKRWVPVLDESLAEQQRAAYAVAGVDETEPAGPIKTKKRKVYTSNDGGGAESNDTKKARLNSKTGDKADNGAAPQRQNKAVYITNLPHDATEDELRELFSKCGVIAEEIDTGRPRIKLYRNDDGTPKGDALIVYFRPESVQLAVQMLDDTDFRFGGGAGEGGRMRVEPADFSFKSQQDAGPKMSGREKRKVIARMQRLNNKLADWDDDDPAALPDANRRWEKVVILKHMFTLQELDEDPTALLDLKEDIREECEKLGEVTNVVLYDKEPDGVVSVRFKHADSAKACIRVMDGRYFGGRTVEAYGSAGNEKFKRSKEGKNDGDDDENARLEKFGSWLEEEDKGGKEAEDGTAAKEAKEAEEEGGK